MLKIFDFARFLSIYRQSGRISAAEIRKELDNVRHLFSLLLSENDISGISTEKALYQNVEKHSFRHIQPGKNQKIAL
jgi:hypothetical protein